MSASSSIMNGEPPWSAGRDGAEKGRTVIGACSQSAREAIMTRQPPRMTVSVPEVVLDGGSGAGSPGAIHIDPPRYRGVQAFAELFGPVGGGEGRGLYTVGERSQDRANQVRPRQVDQDAFIAS